MPDLRAAPPLATVTATNENVIGFLREALKLAERGDIRGAVLVLEHADGTTSDRWATMAGIYPQKLIGALWICLTRFTAWTEKKRERESDPR